MAEKKHGRSAEGFGGWGEGLRQPGQPDWINKHFCVHTQTHTQNTGGTQTTWQGCRWERKSSTVFVRLKTQTRRRTHNNTLCLLCLLPSSNFGAHFTARDLIVATAAAADNIEPVSSQPATSSLCFCLLFKPPTSSHTLPPPTHHPVFQEGIGEVATLQSEVAICPGRNPLSLLGVPG